MGLASSRKLAKVFTASFGGHPAPLAPQDGSRWKFGLVEKVIGQREGCGEEFTATSGAIFGQLRSGENEVGFSYEFSQCAEFALIRCHALKIRWALGESKRSLFSTNALFRHYPTRKSG